MCWFCCICFLFLLLDSVRIVFLFSEFGKKFVYCEIFKRYIRDIVELIDFYLVWVFFILDIDWFFEL